MNPPQDRFRFEKRTSPEIGEAVRKNALILFPIGQVEEHGNHLPLDTDCSIARAAAFLAAESVEPELPALVLPVHWAGYSNKVMMKWPGTIRVRTRVVMDLVFDVCASLIEMGFRRICLINAHGHHVDLLRVVVRELADSHGVQVAIADPAPLSTAAYREFRKSEPGGSIHGGEWETSLMLALGQRVLMDQATDEDRMRYASRFIPPDGFSGSKPVFWSTWGIQESQTGIYGDPTQADAETGLKILEALREAYGAFLREIFLKK